MNFSKKLIRTTFYGRSKLFVFPVNYEDLITVIEILYELNPEEIYKINSTYIDEELDIISVSNSFDLEQAFNFAVKENIEILILELNIPSDKEIEIMIENNPYFDLFNLTTQSIIHKEQFEDFQLFYKRDFNINEYLNDEENSKLRKNYINDNNDIKMREIFERKFKNIYKKLIESLICISKEYRERKLIEFNDKNLNIIDQIKIRQVYNRAYYASKIIKRKILIEENNNTDVKLSFIESIDDSIEYTDNLNLIRELITIMIEKKIEKFKQKLFTITKKITDNLIKNLIEKKQINRNSEVIKNYIHGNVKCNGCEIQPIIGIRYKCSECFDFNFCELCDEKYKNVHIHPFIKIRKPENSNLFVYFSQEMKNIILNEMP